ncbi:MAG: putative transrane protein [Myxococcales bacterium]|nr:putative transrane protein [Myxococcales bacterium]
MRWGRIFAVVGGCLIGCSSPRRESVTPVVARSAIEVPISDPYEYGIDRISRDAGKAIFTRTGVGDPYRTGVPYPIFLALLEAFPRTFGADTQALAGKFGFVARAANPKSEDLDEREGLPIGMHLTIDPITNVPFVVTNCALCHAERIRWNGGAATVIGLGNKRVRIHAYDAAFAEITHERGFSAQHLARLAAMQAEARHLAWPERYRDILVGGTVAALDKRATERTPLRERTEHGLPGRVATIESFVLVLGQLTGRAISYAPQVGWAKVPDVIGFAHRVTLSWDGSGEGPMDLLAVEADVAAGVRVEWMQHHPFQGASLGAYLRQPESRPGFPGKIDRALAERGHKLFEDNCSHCHGTYAADGRALDYDEQVVKLEDIGTDASRTEAATDSFERAANDPALTLGYTKFRRTFGYVPPVLTNVWARAPFGHAGQWPSLAVLATPPAQRPTNIVVDLDALYDLTTVGVATRATGEPGTYTQDATSPGFSVAGHPFLADLGATDSRAVIEYLKTL